MNKYAAEKIASEYYDLGVKLALQKIGKPTNDDDFVGPPSRSSTDTADTAVNARLNKYLSTPLEPVTSGSSAQPGPQKPIFQQLTGLPFNVGRGMGAGYKNDQYSGYAPPVTGGNISGVF